MFQGPHLVFDIESVGLHGEGFAVGWVVVDPAVTPLELESGLAWVRRENARGTDAGREWVERNVRLDGEPTHATLFELRRFFWDRVWTPWRERKATLWADHGWPVEARFLAACADDALQVREWVGPYPLHEIATVRVAAALDPSSSDRRPNEVPVHNPTADARQSSRLLLEALAVLRARHELAKVAHEAGEPLKVTS